MSNSEELKTALADLASLGRVDHKLALTEAENLERVLSVLLPRLLSRIGSNHVNQHQESNTEQLRAVFQKTHEKLVSMLSHIMKRVREDPTCRLPCEAILNLLLRNETGTISYQASVNSLTLNLSLAFLTLGIPRAELRHAEVLLPGMLVLLANHSGLPSLRSPASKLQANQVAHLVLRLSERLVIEDSIASYQSTPPSSISSSAGFKTEAPANLPSPDAMDDVRQLVAGNWTVSQSLYDLLLDVLLLSIIFISDHATSRTFSIWQRSTTNRVIRNGQGLGGRSCCFGSIAQLEIGSLGFCCTD
jgi:hypothetical protein